MIESNINGIFPTPVYISKLDRELSKKELSLVNKSKLNITIEQKNMSFQDIIYNNYKEQWQVGYTGTASLKLNDYFDI